MSPSGGPAKSFGRDRSATGPHGAGDAGTSVRLEGLTKRYKTRRPIRDLLSRRTSEQFITALHDVSLSVPRGVIFGLLGANGAGKSTLMRILATLVLPDGGSVTVEGVDALQEPRRVRRLVASATGDERSLNWRLSVRHNLELYAALYEIPQRDTEAHVRDVLDAVSLAAVEKRLVGQLSSGMKQRVLIARALLPNPRVLLLDEPTRSLDPVSAQVLRAFLRDEVLARRECTVFLATHDSEEAFEVCDELLILHEGRVIERDSAAALVKRYALPRYRIWVRSFSAQQWTALETDALIRSFDVVTVAGNDTPCVEFELPHGEDSLARVLSALVRTGAVVDRIEAVPLTLAALLTRATRARVAPTA